MGCCATATGTTITITTRRSHGFSCAGNGHAMYNRSFPVVLRFLGSLVRRDAIRLA